MAIRDALQLVLQLQPRYKPNHSPETTRRNGLVTNSIPSELTALLKSSGFPVPAEHLHVYGSGGAGLNAKVPWVFIADSRQTTSAQDGWYLVLLFRQDGTGVYASLNKNSTTSPTDQWDAQPIDQATAKAQRLRARSLIDDEIRACPRSLVDTIDLRTNSAVGKAYETTNVTGIFYDSDDLPDDDQLIQDLTLLGHMLNKIYKWDETTNTKPAVPMHLLLKWSRSGNLHHIDEVDAHRSVAEVDGSVTWGCYTESNKGISRERLDLIRAQLASGIPTIALLRESGRPDSAPNIWQAEVAGISDMKTDLSSRLPPHYEGDSHFLFVQLTDFVKVDDSVLADFVLHSSEAPLTKGSISNQTSPLYLAQVAGAVTRPPPGTEVNVPQLEDLSQLTFIPERVLAELLSELRERLVVLAGPPGTGKTWTAKHVANHVTAKDADRIKLVQFHPAMSYESFVQGLQPVTDAQGQVSFRVVDGVAVDFADQATSDPARQPHVLLIDEINRANLPKVLGELIYLLEYRGPDNALKLQYQEPSQRFSLPENLHVLATMNTADRSIRSVDAAIRRRFSVFELQPNPDALRRHYDGVRNRCEFEGLAEGFTALNERLEADIDRHHTVGHTFFMHRALTRERLRTVWRRQILPLLDEYFFDASERVAEYHLSELWPDVEDLATE